jgi:hypothetical protein
MKNGFEGWVTFGLVSSVAFWKRQIGRFKVHLKSQKASSLRTFVNCNIVQK